MHRQNVDKIHVFAKNAIAQPISSLKSFRSERIRIFGAGERTVTVKATKPTSRTSTTTTTATASESDVSRTSHQPTHQSTPDSPIDESINDLPIG